MVPMIPKEKETKSLDITNKHKKIHHLGCLTPKFKIYASHFLSTWSQRMWAFAGGLFLIEITPGSLRLVAVYNFALSFTVMILGSAIGRWVDRVDRLLAIQASLIIQNAMVSLCAIVLCFLVSNETFLTNTHNGWAEKIMQVGVVGLACAAQVGNTGSKLSIEKDWLVIISKGKESTLATLNSVMRTLDLSTQIMAPILVGTVMTAFGMVIGGIMIASWNFVSVIIQYSLLRNLYNSNDDLRKPKLTNESKNVYVASSKMNIISKIKDAMQMWKNFFNQKIKYAGLALALLYMTVLALDNYTVAYLFYCGMGKWLLGILTACASITGILGAMSFPFLHKRFGLLKTGIFGFYFELMLLTLCVVAMFVPGTMFDPYALFTKEAFYVKTSTISNITPTLVEDELLTTTSQPKFLELPSGVKESPSVILMLIGIITSRFGLYLADLTVTQILQEDVAESERGGINGVEYSLSQALSLLRSVILIILPTMPTFGYLVILSVMFVAAASILFSIFASQKTKLKRQSEHEETRL